MKKILAATVFLVLVSGTLKAQEISKGDVMFSLSLDLTSVTGTLKNTTALGAVSLDLFLSDHFYFGLGFGYGQTYTNYNLLGYDVSSKTTQTVLSVSGSYYTQIIPRLYFTTALGVGVSWIKSSAGGSALGGLSSDNKYIVLTPTLSPGLIYMLGKKVALGLSVATISYSFSPDPDIDTKQLDIGINNVSMSFALKF